MPDTLFIGDYAYSSWSMRGWLLFDRFGLAVNCRLVNFMKAGVAEQMQDIAPARTVPTLVTEDDGAVIWDSLAIAEELSDRHPGAGIWPSDPAMRALARSLAAEMHSGFVALRSACPMNLRTAYVGFSPSEEVVANIQRIETIWTHALERSGGPWLAGSYSAADVFFAPVAARIAGFSIPVSDVCRGYVAAHLADPSFRRWRALGLVQGETLPWYAQDLRTAPWPGPSVHAAQAVESGEPENDACPYSGKAPTHLMQMDGRTFGFCNATCRDKTVADPEAWPAFMALV